MELIATFMRERRGPDVIASAPPAWAAKLADAQPVEDDQPNNPHVRFPFFHQLDCKLAVGRSVLAPGLRGRPGEVRALVSLPRAAARWRGPARSARAAADHRHDADRVASRGRAGTFRFFAPSLDLTVYTVDDTSARVAARRDARSSARAPAGRSPTPRCGTTRAGSIAYGTQAMYLQTLSGEPPVVDASGR